MFPKTGFIKSGIKKLFLKLISTFDILFTVDARYMTENHGMPNIHQPIVIAMTRNQKELLYHPLDFN